MGDYLEAEKKRLGHYPNLSDYPAGDIELMVTPNGRWTNRWHHEPKCPWCPHKSSWTFRTRKQALRLAEKDVAANSLGSGWVKT